MALSPTSNLARLLHDFYDFMQRKYDVFIFITGEEGRGKTKSIGLNIFDYWYREILKRKPPAERIGTTFSHFVKNLETGENFDIAYWDETGDALDKGNFHDILNKGVYQTYGIIREKLLLTMMTIPDFWDLDPRFRRRRVRGVFDVHKRVDDCCRSCGYKFAGRDECPKCTSKDIKRGYVKWRYYGRRALNRAIEKNKNKQVLRLSRVKATLEGVAYEYKGELLERYKADKDKRMDDAIKNLRTIAATQERKQNWRCPQCQSMDTKLHVSDGLIHCHKCRHAWEKTWEEGEREPEQKKGGCPTCGSSSIKHNKAKGKHTCRSCKQIWYTEPEQPLKSKEKDGRMRCPQCESLEYRYRASTKDYRCRKCGEVWGENGGK